MAQSAQLLSCCGPGGSPGYYTQLFSLNNLGATLKGKVTGQVGPPRAPKMASSGALHSPAPHQADLGRVRRGDKMSAGDLLHLSVPSHRV